MTIAHFRFYAELNAFLAPEHRQRNFSQRCARDASVKHMIEALGVPHTEVDLILVDGAPVDFAHRLRDGERISVYPHFSILEPDTAPLRPPLGSPRFIADAHLGQLARNLRMLGFDVLYRNDYSDREVASFAAEENRVVLTRDRDLLIRKDIVHGCYLHALEQDRQILEVIRRFRLLPQVRALSRCLGCNGVLRMVDKGAVADRVPAHSRRAYERFYQCACCEQLYWEGSHVERMRVRMEGVLRRARLEASSVPPGKD